MLIVWSWCQDIGVLAFASVLVLFQSEGVESLSRGSHVYAKPGNSSPSSWLGSRLAANISTAGPVSGLLLVSGHQSKIPNQLVLTGKWPSLLEAPGEVLANIEHTLSLNPELRVHYLGDAACQTYIQEHFDDELLQMFVTEKRGSFRGDICRTSVLAHEGGFYTDLDMEWKVPLHSVVSELTSFMSAFGDRGEVLNALMAAEPGSAVMSATLEQLRAWYRSGPRRNGGWMGPVTLLQALRDVHSSACPENVIFQKRQGAQSTQLEWACGQQSFRLYQQRMLNCKPKARLMRAAMPLAADPNGECPPERARSSFDGVRFGLFEPGSSGRLIAWPRFASCGQWGCGGGGWTLSTYDASAL
mmetsp:Transcript_81662/g.141985  ORF Transcript_81662/g.141985 Transcript_81662/m.141985 type:complete len:358 (+) Transcript_81662:37-1110(+)